MPDKQTDDLQTGMQLSQIGSESQRKIAKSDPEAEAERLKQMVAVPSKSTDHKMALRNEIIGPLIAMTNWANLAEQDRQAAGRFWISALEDYQPQEVRDAFKAFARMPGSQWPSPKLIAGIIIAKRKEIYDQIASAERDARLKAEWEAEQNKPEPTPEEKQAAADYAASLFPSIKRI